MLDRLDQDRKVMLFQHLGFIHCPIREHCPAFPNCMDALIERILATKVHRYYFFIFFFNFYFLIFKDHLPGTIAISG